MHRNPRRDKSSAEKVPSRSERDVREIEWSAHALRLLVESIDDAIFILDPEGTIATWNRGAARIHGYAGEEVRGEHISMLLPPEAIERGQPERALETARREGRCAAEGWHVRKDGSRFSARVTLTAIRDESGELLGFGTVVRDRSEGRRAEEAVHETLERLRTLIEASPLAINAVDAEGNVAMWNPASERIFGWSAGDVLGRPLPHVPADRRDEFRGLLRRVLRGETLTGLELTRRRKDGSRIDVSVSAAPIRNAEGRIRGAMAVVEDISKRKRAEADLRETTQELQALVYAAPLPIVVLDEDDRVRLWNPAAEQTFGWTADEVLGRVYPIIPDEKQDNHQNLLGRALAGEALAGVERVRRKKDGSSVTIRIWSAPITDDAGRIRGVMSVNEDITERKQLEAERERLLEREREARAEAERRWEALERVTESRARLMRGFSHDVKNPLGTADASAQLLEMGLREPLAPAQEEVVRKIRRSIGVALHLIDDLVELARAEAGRIEIQRKPVDLREIVDEVIEAYRPEAEAKGLDTRVRVSETLPAVSTDPKRMRQVVGNLVSNAVKYTDEGRVEVLAEARENGSAPGPGRWAAVDVRDTGGGIPAEQQEHLFEEFTRLEPEKGHGAGLGLAISQRIAEELGGRVTVRSEVGEGSTFTLWLPLEGEQNGG